MEAKQGIQKKVPGKNRKIRQSDIMHRKRGPEKSKALDKREDSYLNENLFIGCNTNDELVAWTNIATILRCLGIILSSCL